MTKTWTLILVALLLMTTGQVTAQHTDGSKLSAWVQQKYRIYQKQTHRAADTQSRLLTAFVKTTDQQVLENYGCRVYAHQGDIYIVTIPMDMLDELMHHPTVNRIEASPSAEVTLDSVAKVVNIKPAYDYPDTPFTGKGVVMGVMDVGFDLTHPTFFNDQTLSAYRIKAFWDQLAPNKDAERFPVGQEFVTQEEILAKGCATDGKTQNHGSHTAGIAAGSGYDKPYRGIAFESDICLVANAVTQDTIYIAKEDYDKYTSATDALGFQYIFDYAEQAGKPCVASFSEGYTPYLDDDDQLYSEYLSRLIGPGRILVVSAGNNSLYYTYCEKPKDTAEAGAFINCSGKNAMYRIMSDGTPTLHLLRYGEENVISHEKSISLDRAWEDDQPLRDTLFINEDTCAVSIQHYVTSLTNGKTMYLMTLTANKKMNELGRIALVAAGSDWLVEVYGTSSYQLANRETDTRWNAAQIGRNILAPGCLEAPICVGSTTYRETYTDIDGHEHRNGPEGEVGKWSDFSSIGPSMNGLLKPEVAAPGRNVISSVSTYYVAAHPQQRGDLVEFSNADGKDYPWATNTGTSMSTPVVAGAIAIWLQANPTLTREDVMGVLQRTCRHLEEGLDYPNNKYGFGEVNVYRGLLDVLGASGIEGLSLHQPKAVTVFAQDGLLHLEFNESSDDPVDIRIFALDGHLVAQHHLKPAGKQATLPLPRLSHGIYAVQLNGEGSITGSQLIRL